MNKYCLKVMKCLFVSVFTMLLFTLIPTKQVFAAVDETHPGYRVEGRFLYDNTGEKVILYGLNKMVIWLDKDGDPSFKEMAKTGANSVRIVWTMDGTAAELDTAISNCRAEHMIPIVELHDATGEMSKLPSLMSYWTKPEVVNVIKKHQQYLLVNIGNEIGNGNVTEAEFKTNYETSVKQMRTAGIHVPLIIDAPTWGQNINMLQACGAYLTSVDPDKNLMYSVHMWWPYMYGHTDQEVVNEIAESVNMNLPLIVGEFGNQWEATESGKIPYKLIMEQCYKNQVGYLAWEWGPGNKPQTFLDMTTDGTFATLRDWGLEVAITDTYSIKNIAKRPGSILGNLLPELPKEPLLAGNLAVGKAATASSTESATYSANNVVDGDFGTRWASNNSDPNWVYIDLGAKKEINRVIIKWEAAYATQYKIQVSDDANTWTDVYTSYSGKGQTEDISLTGSGRYVKVYGMARYNNSWPYSIFEIGVYGPESAQSSSISPTVAVFDKNIAKQSDLTVTLSPQSNTLTAIKNGTATLVVGTDYTVSGNTLVIKKSYLASQATGTIKLMLDYNNGVDPIFTVAIGDTTPAGGPTPTIIYGDVNGDKVVNAIDFALLKKYLLGLSTLSEDTLKKVDLNQDSKVNAIDLAIFKQYILGTVTSLPVVK